LEQGVIETFMSVRDKSHLPYLAGLLRARPQGRGCRAEDKGDELAPAPVQHDGSPATPLPSFGPEDSTRPRGQETAMPVGAVRLAPSHHHQHYGISLLSRALATGVASRQSGQEDLPTSIQRRYGCPAMPPCRTFSPL